MSPWVIAGVAIAALFALALAAYFRDRGRLLARMTARTQIAQTALGPVEYTSTGDGPVILSVHGWGGGGSGDYNLFAFLA
ncbi:hypothetical protein, partial [Enterococcus casseliflavus]|uniref:hypothetical protein n=1 Tax=Enterococcus casseliflavus TaxID=37734 RepID=UPI003D0D4C02